MYSKWGDTTKIKCGKKAWHDERRGREEKKKERKKNQTREEKKWWNIELHVRHWVVTRQEANTLIRIYGTFVVNLLKIYTLNWTGSYSYLYSLNACSVCLNIISPYLVCGFPIPLYLHENGAKLILAFQHFQWHFKVSQKLSQNQKWLY